MPWSVKLRGNNIFGNLFGFPGVWLTEKGKILVEIQFVLAKRDRRRAVPFLKNQRPVIFSIEVGGVAW